MSFLYTSIVRAVKHVVKVTDGCPQGLSTAVPWAWKVLPQSACRTPSPPLLTPPCTGPSLTHVYGILSFSIPSPRFIFLQSPPLLSSKTLFAHPLSPT